MKFKKTISAFSFLTFFLSLQLFSQTRPSLPDAEQAMLKATRFMVEKVSTNGGYVLYARFFEKMG